MPCINYLKKKLETVSDEDKPRPDAPQFSDPDGELKAWKPRYPKASRANGTAVTTTRTTWTWRPKTPGQLELRRAEAIAQIFPTSPHAHNNISTYPLPPDQLHGYSYHRPLLLAFPASTESLSPQDPVAAARKHRDALLTWFDNYSAARPMPWQKPWIDPSPLLCPTSTDNMPFTTAAAEQEKQAQTLQTLRSSIRQRFYEVLLAEILRQVLHETVREETIKRVTAYYSRWIQALPTIEDLAKSEVKQVEEFFLKRDIRIVRFHMTARQICSGNGTNNHKNGVGLPTTIEELQNLPGLGQHTAGLVAAVVFGQATPMVEVGVVRVLARQLGLRADMNQKENKEVIWAAARRLAVQVAWDGVEVEEEAKRKDMNKRGHSVDRQNRGPPPLSDRPGRWGQALMELGATVCLPAPKNPKCELCPIQATCRAYAEGLELAREKGLVAKEKDSKREVMGIEDAACTLCPPALPSAKNTQAPLTNKDKKAISSTFYERDMWLRTEVAARLSQNTEPSKLIDPTVMEFLGAYCRQYPLLYYGQPKSQK